MSIESDIIAYLKTDSPLMALVGNGDSPITCRIYPLILPQNWTAPAITYQRISGPRLHDLSGPSGRAMPRIQFDIYGSSYSSVKAVADALRSAIDGHTGSMGSTDIGYVTIENDFDSYSDETEIWRVTMDFIISHVES